MATYVLLKIANSYSFKHSVSKAFQKFPFFPEVYAKQILTKTLPIEIKINKIGTYNSFSWSKNYLSSILSSHVYPKNKTTIKRDDFQFISSAYIHICTLSEEEFLGDFVDIINMSETSSITMNAISNSRCFYVNN